MNSDKLTWFEPFAETSTSKDYNESPGLFKRLLKRSQRASVQIDEQKRSVRFEKSTERFSTGEVESVVSDETEHNIVYNSPPQTLSNVISRIDTIGRNKVSVQASTFVVWNVSL